MEKWSHAQIHTFCQDPMTQVAGDWRWVAWSLVLSQSDQSGKTWLWCHSGLTAPWPWRVLRQLLPALLQWQPSQPSRKKLKEGGPVLCGRLLSEVWPREMRAGRTGAHGWPESMRWGESIFPS
jgi:hypothetical protein